METKSILLTGVGGQGTILSSKILSEGLFFKGFDVKMNEIHGMSQRGGSVVSVVRFGSCVLSPSVEKGGADILAAFEEMEAMRYISYLKKDGIALIAKRQIPCLSCLTGENSYPSGIKEEIAARVKTIEADAYSEACKLGSPQSMNMIMLGNIVRLLDLKDIPWEDIIRENVKKEFFKKDLAAFFLGKGQK